MKGNNIFIAISAVVGVITLVILIMQYRDRKELLTLEKELKRHELDQVKHSIV